MLDTERLSTNLGSKGSPEGEGLMGRRRGSGDAVCNTPDPRR